MIDFEERENSSLLPDLAENADVSRVVDLQDAAGGVRLVLMVEAGLLGQVHADRVGKAGPQFMPHLVEVNAEQRHNKFLGILHLRIRASDPCWHHAVLIRSENNWPRPRDPGD